MMGGEGAAAGTNGYRQSPVTAWQKGYEGWEEDLIFLGGRGAGRKSNPGGLAGTDGYRQSPVTAWQKGSEGWGGGGCRL